MLIFFYEYLILSVVPVWFMSYAAIRMGRHWNDGKDKFIVLNRHVYFKWVLSFLMTVLSFMHVVDLAIFIEIPLVDLASRGVFFSLLLLSWLISFVLGIFENNRRLIMRWSGHRSFWPANAFIHIILMIGDGIYFLNESPSGDWIFILEAIYLSEIIFCCILTAYAVRRPNEFILIDEFNFSFLRRNTRRTIDTTNNSIREVTEYPKISIKSYKIKQEEGRTVIYFTITSEIRPFSYVSKRTLQEFDALNKHIEESFPALDYPNMKIPALPALLSKEIDEKIEALTDYLNSLSFPEFFSKYFLDFLSITGPNENSLLNLNQEVLKNEETVERQQFRSVSVIEKYYSPNTKLEENPDDDSVFFSNYNLEIRLTKWVEVDKHIEYEILWSVKSTSNSGIVFKRYNEILEFHKMLGKLVAPARLPEFPSKNYLQKLSKIDEKALNLRKSNLEAYLNHVYNDVAFLCNESLFFLEINESLESILQANQLNYEIRLISPLICSPVIDDDGHHLVYDIKLIKIQENTKKSEWTISKRYRQFDALHNFLIKRSHSPLLGKFNEINRIKDTNLPLLPGKSVAALVSAADIEARRASLEKYLEEIFTVQGVLQAYVLRQFIQDRSLSDHSYKIN